MSFSPAPLIDSRNASGVPIAAVAALVILGLFRKQESKMLTTSSGSTGSAAVLSTGVAAPNGGSSASGGTQTGEAPPTVTEVWSIESWGSGVWYDTTVPKNFSSSADMLAYITSNSNSNVTAYYGFYINPPPDGEDVYNQFFYNSYDDVTNGTWQRVYQ